VVSNYSDASFEIYVQDVDRKLSLFEYSGMLVFSCDTNSCPCSFPLELKRTYVLRYDNNDGGPGFLKAYVQVNHAAGQKLIPLFVIPSIEGQQGFEAGLRLV
jgi:hypothetical protein